MRQGDSLRLGQRGLFESKESFFFYEIAENPVLRNRELMALGKRNLVLIG